MQLPLEILQADGIGVSQSQTCNIGSGGVCFRSSNFFEPGEKIEYRVTLSPLPSPVRIHCFGRILRTRRSTGAIPTSENDFLEVVVSMERYLFLRGGESPLMSPAEDTDA